MSFRSEIKLVTPISHLFNDIENASKIKSLSDELEARERTCDLRFDKTSHYHIDFDLNLGLNERQKEFLHQKVKNRSEIDTLTFQITRDTEEFKFKNGKFYPKGLFIDEKEQLMRIKHSIKIIKDIVGSHRSIGIENNNFYDTGAYEIATSSKFINKAINSSGCHLLLDIAHAKVTCENKEFDLQTYIKEMTSGITCKQMHLCDPSQRMVEGKKETYDAHLLPDIHSIDQAVNLCEELKIKHLTIEYYKDTGKLVDCLKIIRKLLNN